MAEPPPDPPAPDRAARPAPVRAAERGGLLVRMDEPVERRLLGRRTRLVVVASTAYTAAAALRAAGGEGARVWGAALAAITLAWIAGGRERWRGAAEWGLAFTVAAFGAPDAEGWVAVAGTVGASFAALAGVMAIARVAAPEGIARPKKSSPLFGLAVLSLLSAIGITARVLRAGGSPSGFAAQAGLLAFFAAVLSGAFLIGEARDVARTRRLELGVAARMHAAVGLGAATGAVAWAVAFVGFAPPEPVARVALALGATLFCRVALRGDPVDLARASRRMVALTVVGGPLIMLAAAVAEGRPSEGSAAVAVIGALALAIGAGASWLEDPLRPARGAWLDAVAAAHDALLRTDSDEAIREALIALLVPAGLDSNSPELWTFDPMLVTTVDAAGYPQTRPGTLPERLVLTAAGEPEAILRHEVLCALEVRRPELRPLARWMEDHGAMAAAVVTRAGEPEGFLVLPRGRRTASLSLEEARAIKQLADALAALCHARAALARSRDRERLATVAMRAAEEQLERAHRELERRAAQHVLAAERLARPATIGIYSAAARMAFDAIEDTLRAARTLFVHAPPGVDPVPYVARAHLASARRGEPLVVVDGTSTREHDVARWRDPLISPLALADRGLLLLVDGAALPADVQRLVAGALADKRAPWAPDEVLADVALALSATSPLPELQEGARLDAALAAHFAAAESTSLPRLRDRPEDLRAIVSDRLAREGLRVRGAPLGIDDAAYSRLLDHPFDGEDAELAALVQRLAALCDGDVVRAAHMDAALREGAIGAAEREAERLAARGAQSA
ncbi:MAG TPA: hypothetical protein VGI39_04160 [Polyangiaceae bacterium]